MTRMAVADPETGELMADAPGHAFGDVDVAALRKYVIDRQGKDFLLYSGLVAALHQLSGGYFAIETRVEQLPNAGNGDVAVCSARVAVFDRDAPEITVRAASGIGDASEENVGKQMKNATIRLAETRAKARALRDLMGFDMVTFEELGPAGADEPAVDTIEVDGRRYTRGQVLDVYHGRLTQAESVGLQLAPLGTPGGPPSSDAPLSVLVKFSAELKRRLEALSAAK